MKRKTDTEAARRFWETVDRLATSRDPRKPPTRIGEAWADSRHDLSMSLAGEGFRRLMNALADSVEMASDADILEEADRDPEEVRKVLTDAIAKSRELPY